MIAGLGTPHGYATLWDSRSRDLSTGGAPHFDIIAPRAITFAPDVRANLWHVMDTAFASTRARTLEVFADARGLGFSAEVPETPSGYNLFNGLREGRSLGISPEFRGHTVRWSGNDRIITKVEMTGLAICEVAAAAYPQSGAGYAAAIVSLTRRPRR